jgi:hypothetical protein
MHGVGGIVLVCLVLMPGAPRAAQWQTTTEELLRAQKPGFGGLCGVVVDHQTGDVIVNVSDRGFFRSTDQGKSWKRLGPELKGRTEWPGCLQIDPTGKSKTIASALVYGAPLVVSVGGDGTWETLDRKSSHVDWFALDWTDLDHKFVLASSMNRAVCCWRRATVARPL